MLNHVLEDVVGITIRAKVEHIDQELFHERPDLLRGAVLEQPFKNPASETVRGQVGSRSRSATPQFVNNPLRFRRWELLNASQPLDGFESPKAFTFQYYLTISPATVAFRNQTKMEGYQFRAGSFVTNELIGPAVFFRLDIDPIRVTYYTEEARLSKFLVNICAIVGGCIAVVSMLSQLLESAVACVNDRD